MRSGRGRSSAPPSGCMMGWCRTGFSGSYPTVQRFVKAWHEERRHGPGTRLHSAELRAGRGVSVRLELRDGRSGRSADAGEGRPPALVSLAGVPGGGVSARSPGDGVRCALACVQPVGRQLPARDLRQPQDRGRADLHRQGAAVQPQVPADGQPLPDRAGGVHAGGRAGRRGRSRTRSVMCARTSSRRGCAAPIWPSSTRC